MKHNNIDWKNKGKEYWKEIFNRVREEGYNGLHGTDAIKLVKSIRNIERMTDPTSKVSPKHMMIDPIQDYGFVVGTLIRKKLDKLIIENGNHCIDNLRWANMNKSYEIKRYKKAQKNGCCGFMDVKVNIFGAKFLLGFNYGH